MHKKLEPLKKNIKLEQFTSYLSFFFLVSDGIACHIIYPKYMHMVYLLSIPANILYDQPELIKYKNIKLAPYNIQESKYYAGALRSSRTANFVNNRFRRVRDFDS